MASLVCESGADKRTVFELEGEKIVCGRSKKATICINDPFASGKHFGLVKKGDDWYIKDLDSANGIEVNDIPVDTERLSHGDLIRIGSTYLRFLAKSETAEEASKDDLPVLSGYDISERLGVGGMGMVYLANQRSLNRQVALKVLSPSKANDKEFVKNFFFEARAAGKLNHQNIVQVHDVGEEDGICYMCMEYVGGGNLTDLLRETGMLDQKKVIEIAIDIAQGLEFARSKDLVHCDIKPDNIMFTETGMAKIADLGIARRQSDASDHKQQTSVMGSPHYMAPEQAMGKAVDHRADLYALGCTIFRMLTGRTPYSGSSAREVMKQQVSAEHPDIIKLVPKCSPKLADIVDMLMEKKPDDRCQTAADLLKLLEAFGQKRKKKKNPAIKNAPIVKQSVAGRAEKATKTNMSFIYIPVAALALFLVFFAFKYFSPGVDEAKVHYDKAIKFFTEGKLERAKIELKGTKGTLDRKLLQDIKKLRNAITEIEEKEAKQQEFLKAYAAFKELTKTETDPKVLNNKFEELWMNFADTGERRRAMKVDKELYGNKKIRRKKVYRRK